MKGFIFSYQSYFRKKVNTKMGKGKNPIMRGVGAGLIIWF
jgi:hypothetical protein